MFQTQSSNFLFLIAYYMMNFIGWVTFFMQRTPSIQFVKSRMSATTRDKVTQRQNKLPRPNHRLIYCTILYLVPCITKIVQFFKLLLNYMHSRPQWSMKSSQNVM